MSTATAVTVRIPDRGTVAQMAPELQAEEREALKARAGAARRVP